jgi:ABC-type arginine transport system permease subunit
MKIRKITSLTASLSFLLMVLTSIVLYIVPQGRVAYWADWRLWGLTKSDWGNIHINLGLLFLLALFLHIYFNWKPLLSYLKNKTKSLILFTPEFIVASVITVAFIVGSYFLVPPFSWVMALNNSFKDAGAEKYGEPPYGHAELSSLKTFSKKMNLDLEKSLLLLGKAGYPVENGKFFR